MNRNDVVGLFLSTDSRIQYAEDVLTALALPRGVALQLRYDDRYLSEELRRWCASGEVIGRRFVISFMSGVGSGQNFLVPVRFCRVTSVIMLGGVWIFGVAVQGYPDVDNWPKDRSGLSALGLEMQMSLGDPLSSSFSFASHTCAFAVLESAEDARCWSAVARCLSFVPTFGNKFYFLQVGYPAEMENSRSVVPDNAGTFRLREERIYRLPLSYWSAETDPQETFVLDVATRGDGLDIISAQQTQIKSRYDGSEVLFKSASVSSPSICRMEILAGRTDSGMQPLKAGVKLTIRTMSSRLQILSRVSVSAVAALLLAVPSILGSNTSVGVRLAIAGIGAIALGLMSSGAGTWRKK